MAKSNERKIRVKVFTWDTVEEDQLGRKVLKENIARRGETVELPDEAIALGEREDINAFYSSKAEAEAEESEFNAAAATLDEVVEWMDETSPTVQETVDASKGDPSTARKLLDAEGAHTGGEPRVGVQEGLTKVVEDANQ
jgi:hypothetical protein